MIKSIIVFKEKYKNEKEIEHVVDFLKAEYGNKKSINFNYEQALEKANLWTLKINEKNKGLKSSGLVETIKDFGCGFRIVRLIDQESKDWEGLHMRHCVSSYKDHQGIYSLRDSNNIPHCTIEIEDNEIKQIKGKANGKVSPKYVDFVLDFLQSIDLELSNDDIVNLGYVKNVDLSFIKEHFNNYKIIKIKNEEFLYVGNQLKLIKNFDSKNENLLIYFCKYNQCFEAVKLLIENGIDINAANDYSLRYASEYGHLNIVKFLVETGANINDQYDISLRVASQNGHLDVVKFLVEKGTDIHARDDSPLRLAIVNGHLDVVKFLIEKGANIHARNDDPLVFASRKGHLDVVKFLFENGADIHAQEDSSLCWASQNGRLDIVKFLVENGSYNSFMKNDCLKISIEYGHFELVKYFVENGATVYYASSLYACHFHPKRKIISNFLLEKRKNKEIKYISF